MDPLMLDAKPVRAGQLNHSGLFQQHAALLVRLGLLVDCVIIFSTLYLLVRQYDAQWNESYIAIALSSILGFEVTASFAHLYRSWRLVRLRHELLEILLSWSFSFALVTAVLYLISGAWADFALDRHVILAWYLSAFVGIAGFRICMRMFLRIRRASGHDTRAVAFFGANETTKNLAGIFRAHPWMGVNVAGCFDDRMASDERELAIPKSQIAGNISVLQDLARRGEINAVYIALPMGAEKRIQNIIQGFADTTASIYYCPTLLNFDLLNARWDDVYGQPVISIVETPFRGHAAFLKRVEDLVLVMLILPLILVPLLVIGLAVKLTSRGPVLFRQSRYGLDGREFQIWKFRTMYRVESDSEYVQARRQDARVTPLGAFLRKTSLDELPQFLNVLSGSMSVVGPRPHPIKLNEEHRTQIYRYMLRHKVKPGITGWAQVNGYRGETDSIDKMEKRVEHDLEYIRRWSIGLDMRIIFKTAHLMLFDSRAY